MATIKDVAAETGLSVGTVSRVLNNRGYISGETRAKVDKAMKKLNYQPNEIARSLSKSTSSIIGIIIPMLENPYFSSLVSAVEYELEERNYQSLLFISDGDDHKEMELLEECRRNRVAGIILCSGNFNSMRLDDMNVPIVSIERQKDNCSVLIECDNISGGRQAAKHLLDCGCKKPVYIAGFQDGRMPADDRLTGYADILAQNGVPIIVYSAQRDMFHKQDYHELLGRMFDENPDLDGVFASSDVIAAQVIQECYKRGIRVPEDVSVIGFDDSMLASLLTPPLTSVRQPIADMAALAVSSVLRAVSNVSSASTRIKVDVSLVVRDSTKVCISV